MKNRFFTLMIIPENSPEVKRIIIPSWVVRASLLSGIFAVVLGGVMLFDYWYVMSQIGENKQLKIENRRLRQQVQIFKNKMTTVEATMDRVKTFTTRLKVITNIEDRGNLIQTLNSKLPDAATNVPGLDKQDSAAASSKKSDESALLENQQIRNILEDELSGEQATPTDQLSFSIARGAQTLSPEEVQLRREYEELDAQFSSLNHEALLVEQVLQDQYELLADKQAFLAALPTRKPAVGYFTSGFGIRRSPYGASDRVKMHEGLDIANLPGTVIRAPADGIVVFSESKPGYGQTVILDHGYGLETWYAHTRKVLVSKGQRVRRGDQIALLGSSGRSTGPHLHYEVRVNGTPVDPMSYILEN
jgi:murein DD-endopeptidase MepM/ murein hydrolase activator NlpD